MNKTEAIKLLSYHSGRNNDIKNPKWISGFLGSLRPYQGKLTESNFHEVIECLKVLSETIRNNSNIDKEIVSNLMGIIHLGRAWGVNKNGILRKNGLISNKSYKLLESWIEIISYTFFCLLDGCDDEVAFENYYDFLDKSETNENKIL